jgi:thymidylate synthase (FAD)
MTIINTPFPVLDKGHVTLIDLLPHPLTGITPDMAVVNAARVSFLGESKGEERDKKLLFYLMEHKHGSPFEMAIFKIRIKAPLMVMQHWVRYRMQSINAQSGRYTEVLEDEFYVPSEWRKQSTSNKQGSEGVLDGPYSGWLTKNLDHSHTVAYRLYQEALALGVAREQARLFLPAFAQYSTWVVAINARSLMNVFEQRLSPDAQHETRAYAQTIYREIFKPLMPWTAEAFETYTLPAPIVRMSNRDA